MNPVEMLAEFATQPQTNNAAYRVISVSKDRDKVALRDFCSIGDATDYMYELAQQSIHVEIVPDFAYTRTIREINREFAKIDGLSFKQVSEFYKGE